MNREETLRLLHKHKPIMASQFDVKKLALFGSRARGSASDASDVDILVSFDGPATSARYFGLQFYLEDLLGAPIDLVTDKALRHELKPYIESEALDV